MEIIAVSEEGEKLDDARMLFKEYTDELNENLCFQSFDDELKYPLKKYGTPPGALFVAYINHVPVGCIAMQPLQQNGVCEMKRLYVRPGYRSVGVGEQLIKTLLVAAKEKAYTKMVLDTLERLQPAIKLYLHHGFVNTSPYYSNPLNNVVFMEKEL